MSRTYCPQCSRAQTACICHCVHRVINQTAVLILQHPSETKHTKGTAKLLNLCLSQCQIIQGEIFTEQALTDAIAGRRAALLYPSENTFNEQHTTVPDQPASALALPLPYCQEDSAIHSSSLVETKPCSQTAIELIILLDGTWRKSYKMLQVNPTLQTLSRLHLQSLKDSQYHIRKAPKTGQLSTLEACAQALHQHEQLNVEPLYQAQAAMIQQIQNYQANSQDDL